MGLHVCVEIDRDALKVSERWFEGVVKVADIKDVTMEMVIKWRKLFPAPVVVISGAGSPCQDLSSLKVDGEGLDGSKSNLFFTALKVHSFIELAFAGIPWLDFIENVGSMDPYWTNVMTRSLHRPALLTDPLH